MRTMAPLALVCLLVVVLLLSAGCSKPKDEAATTETNVAVAPTDADKAAEPAASEPAVKEPAKPAGETKPEAEGDKWITTDSGLKYMDVKVGAGPSPKAGQVVLVHYVGKLKDGTKFDASRDHGDQPLDFPIGVGRVIKGWDEGVITMKVGGKRKLIIPSDLGYGPEGAPPVIPPNAELHFEVELVGIQ